MNIELQYCGKHTTLQKKIDQETFVMKNNNLSKGRC
jgi:hypothetical protein